MTMMTMRRTRTKTAVITVRKGGFLDRFLESKGMRRDIEGMRLGCATRNGDERVLGKEREKERGMTHKVNSCVKVSAGWLAVNNRIF